MAESYRNPIGVLVAQSNRSPRSLSNLLGLSSDSDQTEKMNMAGTSAKTQSE